MLVNTESVCLNNLQMPQKNRPLLVLLLKFMTRWYSIWSLAIFSDLTDHYLFAVLHEIFYISLMAENQRRLQHLEGAVKHLDDETVNLRRKSQIYRQEEITEEIEVILLNSEIN